MKHRERLDHITWCGKWIRPDANCPVGFAPWSSIATSWDHDDMCRLCKKAALQAKWPPRLPEGEREHE